MNTMEIALLTNVEAEKKWCPEGRGLQIFDDKPTVTNDGSCCVGSDCMFWRWHDRRSRVQAPIHLDGRVTDDMDDPSEQGHWELFVDTYDCGDRQWFTDRDAARAAYSAQHEGDDFIDAYGRGMDCQWRFIPTPLPPRGYCGKAGHPLKAALIEAQIELVHAQMRALEV